MRTKTKAKRQAIIDAAAELFGSHGFEGTTIGELCARLGSSKTTIYSYFTSKEELFFEVVSGEMRRAFETDFRVLEADRDCLDTALRRFGERMVTALYSPSSLAVRRLMATEPHRSAIGPACYERGPKLLEQRMAGFIEARMQAGQLRSADPLVATRHLRGLLEAELLDDFLFGLVTQISKARIKAVSERAVAVFLAAYSPAQPAGAPPS